MRSYESSFLLSREHTLERRFVTLRRQRSATADYGNGSQRYLLFSARNAIFWALKALNIAPGSHVLVPAYICRAAIEPIIAYGAVVDFYAVTRNCHTDLSDLESRVQNQTRAIFAVHYFGFPHSMELLKDLCERFGLYLIEDCAHVLKTDFEERGLGTFGHASVFSWRKFLPMYDGGELVINGVQEPLNTDWGKEPFLLTLKIAKSMIENAFYSNKHLTRRRASIWIGAVQSVWNHLKNNRSYQNQAISFDNNDTFDERAVCLRMSAISRYIMAHSDILGIIGVRKENYKILSQELSSIDGIRVLFPEFPESSCPWVFPLIFDNIPYAHLILRRCGIPAVMWDGVRPPAVSSDMFPDADFLYRNLVFLPVHQSLKKHELESMIKIVKSVRQGVL